MFQQWMSLGLVLLCAVMGLAACGGQSDGGNAGGEITGEHLHPDVKAMSEEEFKAFLGENRHMFDDTQMRNTIAAYEAYHGITLTR